MMPRTLKVVPSKILFATLKCGDFQRRRGKSSDESFNDMVQGGLT